MPWLLCAQSVSRFYPVDASDKGITYFLPQTRIVVSLTAEESRFEPGCYARYAGILLGKKAELTAQAAQKLTNAAIETEGIPDESQVYTIQFRPQNASSFVSLTSDGILAAINADPIHNELKQEVAASNATSGLSAIAPVFPAEYGLATSAAKRAEIAAKLLFDLREDLRGLIAGKAENAPSEGEAYRLMVRTLQEQIAAVEALFYGTRTTQSYVKRFNVLPDAETKELTLARFSEKEGFVSPDSAKGDAIILRIVPSFSASLTQEETERQAKLKGIVYNVPGRATATLLHGGRIWIEKEVLLSQFGMKSVLSNRMGRSRSGNIAVQFDTATGALIDISEAAER